MDITMVVLKVLILQVVLAGIIICILKIVLDKMLTESAVKKFDVWRPGEEEQKGLYELVVITHKPLAPAVRQQIERLLMRKFQRKINLIPKIDKALWGGIVIEAGEWRIDHSLATRLKEGGFLR